MAFGVLVAATALPVVALFLRDDPREMGLHSDGIPGSDSTSGLSKFHTPRTDAASKPGMPSGYWIVFCANLLRGIAVNALLVHQVAYLVDVGYGKMAAASYVSLSSLVAIPCGVAAGTVSDRMGRPRTYAGIASSYVIDILCLLLVRSPVQVTLVYFFVLVSGIAIGGHSPVFAALLIDRLTGPSIRFPLGSAEYRVWRRCQPWALPRGYPV